MPGRGFRAAPALATAAALLAAGCFTGDRAQDDGATVGYDAEDIPAGCDPSRPAFVHAPEGVPVDWTGPVGIPCLVSTPWNTWEPSLGLTGDGTLFLYPALEQPFDGAGEVAAMVSGVGIARSLDEGGNFTRLLPTVAGPVNWHPATVDPYLYVDPYTDRIFIDDLMTPPFNCSQLSFSDDGGGTWTPTLGGCMVFDHVGYASGPPTVSDPSYPVVLQRCAITLGATIVASFATGCQKSLDGGMTWLPPGEPAFLFDQDGQPYAPSTCHGGAHHPFIDHRGWTWLARTWCDGNPYVAVSKDEGATWAQHLIAEGSAEWHDVGIGVDPAGTVYAFWIDEDLRPVVAVSHDDGGSWSEPIDVAPPGLTAAGMASIAPGGVGKAALSYVATFEGMPETHGVVTAAFGLHGDAPIFQSAIVSTADDPLQAGTCSAGRCSAQNDFLDATIGPDGTAWGSFKHDLLVSAGRIWGAPSLWDDTDPDGPYGGWAWQGGRTRA